MNVKNCVGSVITSDEVHPAIKMLNSGKAPDEYGVKSEVLHNLADTLTPILTDLFNKCSLQQNVLIHFKRGTLTSIPKKNKPPEVLDNHRGITVTTTIGKVLEHVILKRLKPVQAKYQSTVQFGFTQNLNPSMATLLITEAANEARELKSPLWVCTLDAKKAFDTVDHNSLVRKMYNTGIDRGMVAVLDSMYQDMTTVYASGRDYMKLPLI